MWQALYKASIAGSAIEAIKLGHTQDVAAVAEAELRRLRPSVLMMLLRLLPLSLSVSTPSSENVETNSYVFIVEKVIVIIAFTVLPIILMCINPVAASTRMDHWQTSVTVSRIRSRRRIIEYRDLVRPTSSFSERISHGGLRFSKLAGATGN